MGTYREIISELKEPTRSLRSATPEVWACFGAMHQTPVTHLNVTVAPGAVPCW